MPAETAFVVLPVVVLGFIALVFGVLVAVVVSRLVRLARGGPDAERLRQQLMLQRRFHLLLQDRQDTALEANRAFLDQQQQIATDLASPPPSSNPPA